MMVAYDFDIGRSGSRQQVVSRRPSYAPDLNPVEAVWSLVRRATANTALDAPHDLDRKLRRRLCWPVWPSATSCCCSW